MADPNRRLMLECQQAAAHSRQMWAQMRRTGHGWTWDFYRGWLQDARDVRLGRTFQAHGAHGITKHRRRTPRGDVSNRPLAYTVRASAEAAGSRP